MKPRRLNGMCGGPYSVDARSRSSSCVTLLSPPAFSELLPVTLLTSMTHPGPRACTCHAHLYPCPSQSFFITQSTRNGHITSFASCLLHRPCPSQWGFHHDKGRDGTIWVLSIPQTVSPAPLHLIGAQPVPCSCPHVGKARRITNPECSRSLEKECSVSKGCAWKNGTVPGMHPQGRAVKWAWDTGYEEVTRAGRTACGQWHSLGRQWGACTHPLSILTQGSK